MTFVEIVIRSPPTAGGVASHVPRFQLLVHIGGSQRTARSTITHAAEMQIRTLAQNIAQSLFFGVWAIRQLYSAQSNVVFVGKALRSNISEPVFVYERKRSDCKHVAVCQTTANELQCVCQHIWPNTWHVYACLVPVASMFGV